MEDLKETTAIENVDTTQNDDVDDSVENKNDSNDIKNIIKELIGAELDSLKSKISDDLKTIDDKKKDLDKEKLYMDVKEEMKNNDLDFRLFNYVIDEDIEKSKEKIKVLKETMDDVIKDRIQDEIDKRISSAKDPQPGIRHVESERYERPSYMR